MNVLRVKMPLAWKFEVNRASTFWVIQFCVYLLDENKLKTVPHLLNNRVEFTPHRWC